MVLFFKERKKLVFQPQSVFVAVDYERVIIKICKTKAKYYWNLKSDQRNWGQIQEMWFYVLRFVNKW